MKKIIAIICISIVIIFLFIMFSGRTKEFHFKNVGSIVILNNNKRITDKKDISSIIQSINNNVFYKDKLREDNDIFRFTLAIYDTHGKQIDKLGIIGSDEIKYNGYFYITKNTGHINIEILSNYMQDNSSIINKSE